MVADQVRLAREEQPPDAALDGPRGRATMRPTRVIGNVRPVSRLMRKVIHFREAPRYSAAEMPHRRTPKSRSDVVSASEIASL
jgi:hypothetical protein